MHFDRMTKMFLRGVVALCFLTVLLAASTFTFCLFYMSEHVKHYIVSTDVLGNVQITAYRSVKSQTDSSPFITSIGHRTHPFGCAVSQDLLKSGKVKYGDVIYIPNIGFRMVNDTMNKRIKGAIDLWVSTKEDEKKVGIRKVSVVILRVNRD